MRALVEERGVPLLTGVDRSDSVPLMTPEQYVPKPAVSNTGRLAFPARLREARLAKGLTRRQLALACGVTDRAIYNWETGARHPRGPMLPALEQILDRPVAWFFTEDAAA